MIQFMSGEAYTAVFALQTVEAGGKIICSVGCAADFSAALNFGGY